MFGRARKKEPPIQIETELILEPAGPWTKEDQEASQRYLNSHTGQKLRRKLIHALYTEALRVDDQAGNDYKVKKGMDMMLATFIALATDDRMIDESTEEDSE